MYLGQRKRSIRPQRKMLRAWPKAARVILLILSMYLLLLPYISLKWHHRSPNFEPSFKLQNISACAYHMRKDCIRILEMRRTTAAGLGHQIAEVVFGLHMAESYDAVPWIESFQNTTSFHELAGYPFLGSMLGLDGLLPHKSVSRKRLKHIRLYDGVNDECNVYIEGSFKDCNGSDCFASGALALAFHKQAPCLMQLARTYGDWHLRNPFENQTASNVFNVVWHVRIGDIEPHPAGDIFYSNMCESLKVFLASFVEVRLFFLSKWTTESEELYTTTLPDACLRYEFKFISPAIEDTLLYMMHSDLLIGSGSSLPVAAAVFSDRSLYVNVQPKHGWNFLDDYILDGLVARDDGYVVNHLNDIRHKYKSKNENYIIKLRPTENW